MSSQGQRFRRRALRRGYKVDEVDSFLDRVEATLAGEQVGPPVGAQEVHDVVFRVRFGGYDEWQVDLHLDRVERQLAELEDRGGRAPAPDAMRDSMRGGFSAMGGMGGAQMGGAQMGGAQMGGAQMGGAQMGGAQMGGAQMGPPTERFPAPMTQAPMTQAPMTQAPMTQAPMAQRPQAPQGDPYGRYEESYGQQPPPMAQRGAQPGYGQGGFDQSGYDQGGYEQNAGGQSSYDGFAAGRHGKVDMTTEMRMPQHEQDPRGYGGTAPMGGRPMSGPPTGGQPMGGPQAGGPPTGGPPMSGLTMGGPQAGGPQMGGSQAGGPPMGGPQAGGRTMGGQPPGGRPMNGPPMTGPQVGGAAMGGAMMANPSTPNPSMASAPRSDAPAGGYGPPQAQVSPPIGEPGGELHRVDQLRRTFQPRRFGSGYDPMQVDRLFDGLLQAMSGRGPMPVPENELDMLQFGLVPGGYFEAEVDAALREVKDILLRRR